jgi:hypothetical protein
MQIFPEPWKLFQGFLQGKILRQAGLDPANQTLKHPWLINCDLPCSRNGWEITHSEEKIKILWKTEKSHDTSIKRILNLHKNFKYFKNSFSRRLDRQDLRRRCEFYRYLSLILIRFFLLPFHVLTTSGLSWVREAYVVCIYRFGHENGGRNFF